ncbi:titin homolog isoform X2 [Pseudomyrmex gracilis]|uniref:titin homolog isoform X2 n=1 Tax=Pseudomyrmex gracilis TaxID=219809 RepID=UPI000995A7C8|nr:titin homolog isoform X2 [Pseudomyrmex gracilis]
MAEPKSQQQQSYYEHSVNQIQLPIDISLTAATPVYNKDYSTGEEYENSSEYAQKACKTSSGSRPRRVSFEKYNFPRKYDGKEQWTSSIKDLSKFDISTQLSLRKKQQLIKERLTRLRQTLSVPCETTDVSLRDKELEPVVSAGNQDKADGSCELNTTSTILDTVCCDSVELPPSETKKETEELSLSATIGTEFSSEFADFMRLRKREQSDEITIARESAFVELSGEWSRKRIYICGACASKHVTLKEMEEHKALVHPRVLCSHFELVDEQREHYQYLYLPGRCPASDEAQHAVPTETVCTKCAKNCLSVAELHRHMLECGGDHAWLLGLTGSGKKKCKWRPFGSRSRRRRQRGMKRNIQNSQTPQPRIRENVDRPKEKQTTPTGPRIRPSDRESIQKMLANLPPKRTTRKVLQDSAIRTQGKLRNVQTRTRSHIIGDDSSRISRNKAALRNKLLKNAKSIQRNRCRNDNITAAIESVVRKCHEVEKKSNGNSDKNAEIGDEGKRDTKEINESSLRTVDNKISNVDNKIVRPRLVGRPRVLGKKRNVKTKMGLIVTSQFPSKSSDKLANVKSKGKLKCVTTLETKDDANDEETFSPKNTPKNTKTIVRAIDKDGVSPDSKKPPTPGIKNKNKSAQRMLKMKRSVDPVASMNASIKAKSQLRSQDGKFARNPNKDSSAKMSEAKTDEGKQKPADSTEIKIKLKATQKSKKTEVQPPRRVTRLSSDSDKMPTLEPVAQIVSSNEEYADKSANDLPILSPATSSISLQDQKASRSSIKCVSKEKEDNIEADSNVEIVSEKCTKEQKSTRGRKPKQEARDITKRKEIDTSKENEDFKNKMPKQGRTRSRKSLPVKNTNNSENNKQEGTSKDETNTRRELKSKKEEGTKEMRSTSKTKTEKDSVTRDIPFEVKKLLGSVSTEDLLNTLELASNDAGLKRSLRYSTPKLKTPQTSDKITREIDDEQDGSKGVSKKEKIETVRKSSRKNIEKKNDDKVTETIQDKDPVSNVSQNEKNHGKRDSRASVKAKEISDSSDVETKIDNKQTRRSLVDVKSESSSEIRNDSFRKDNSLSGKRRSRNKSSNEAEETNAHAKEEQNNIENVTFNEKQVEKEIDEAIEKIDENKIDDANSDSNTDNRSDSAMTNINLNHLQSETNLSVDSGKENSLEISVSKLKATRPKKTWGVRRERSSRKRSLNNVIGILTEGMNIPIEAQQQSVQVLTVQTSLDNPDRVTRNGSTQQPRGGEGNVIAADSAFNELPVLARSEQESSENAIVTATSATDDHHANDEKNTRSSSEKVQDDAFVAQKSVNAKARSPANDIILDLSRRKPKGKGSFLEKIVSKIAKQKDAMLENEVGSLLDSAAEELTSILNEVGPTLVDNAESENAGETPSHALEKDNNKNAINTSHDKESPITTNLKVRPLEDDKINVESAAPERSNDLMLQDKVQDNIEENLVVQIETQIQSEKEVKINSASNIETRSDDNVDAIHSSVDESQIESCENKVTTNEEAIVITEASLPLANNSTEASPQNKSLEKLEKKGRLKKSRRKSNKRSLEDASWPRKSKRKSTEVVEELVAEENITQKKSHFDDTLISKSEESDVVNGITEQNLDITKSSNEDVDFEKIQHNSESKTVEGNLKTLSLEENLAECDDKLKLEKSDNITEDAKSVSNFKESADKLMSEQEATVADVLSKEVSDENVDSSKLFSKNSTENEKISADIIKKMDQTDTSESTSRYTSRRKSRQSAIFPENTNTDLFETSMKSADESEKSLLLSAEEKDTLGLTDQQLMKVGTITEDTSALLEQSYSSVQETVCKKQEEAQNTDHVNSISSKTKRKRSAKKKSLADEHLELPVDEPVELISKLEETGIVESNEQLSASPEHFKIPEVKDLLQNTKKRGSRKKSLPEEGRWNGGNVVEESRTSEDRAEKEVSNIEKTKEQEETEKCVIEEQLDTNKFERSSSSSSIEFASTVTRSRRRIQLSNEDLVNSGTRNQGESTDDLSENSCASESSYFRKKRFAKKKRKEKEETCDDARADSFVAESEFSKSNMHEEKNKRESLCDEHLDLSDVDDIDALMDIQASLENTKVLENIEREFELADKSSDVQNKDTNKPVTDDSVDDSANKDSSENVPAASNDPDSLDDSVTLKKRAADNFVVVHKKTGEIMIVEKRKKLTKEAAKFFCEVCATSFTRKSSLKKHTLSQWHLLQMEKSKDKIQLAIDTVFKSDEEITNAENDQASDQQKSVPEDVKPSEIIRKSLESYENYASYATSAESTTSVMNLEAAKQETLEDKLLDEEICKITENMSHDEYVLTDHITPEKPTPIKPIEKKHEDSVRGKNGDKKRTKKKKNLADEHLLLDSPELEKSKDISNEFTNSANDAVRISSLSSSLTKEISETVEEKTENQAELLVNFLNDATDCTSSACDIDMTTEQHTESTRTSRRARKLSTLDNEEKEENQTSTESSRFSLRPRRSKHIQHYEESDVEADVYFMDISMDVSDETESCNQYKTEKETNEDALSEAVRVNEDNISQEAAKPKATNETRKRKRGRPRLKDQIDTAVRTESEVKENSVVVTSDIEESNLKDQNPSSQAKENLDDIGKQLHVDANIQPPKRRGRPRKNLAQIAGSSSVKADSDCYESLKTNSQTTEETANQIDTSCCETTIVEKVVPVVPLMTPAINDEILKLHLSETEKNLVNVEKIQNTELENTSENQSMQSAEQFAKTVDITLAKDCDNAILVSSEKDEDDVDESILSKLNARDDDAEFISQNESNHDEVKEDVLSDSTAKQLSPVSSSPIQITEEVSISINHLPSVGVKTDGLDEDESSEVQKLSDISEISEEKRSITEEETVISQEKEIIESTQNKAKLSEESESSEDENLSSSSITENNKSLPAVNSHESQHRETIENLEDDTACDEKTIRLESSNKKSSRNSQSKERGSDCKKSKSSKGKRERISMSKIAELSSDSENEDDKIESACTNKNKIVKSVFGRVFGGEKNDKMKEVLNDWVSRSEDDSDMSRSASNVKSCPRGSKISVNGHKKDKKRHSDTKKDVERVHKKKIEKDAEVHGKSKNRKKREKDPDSTLEDHTELLNQAKRSRYKESKIKADKRILRTFESSIVTDEDGNADKNKEMENQFQNDLSCEKDEESSKRYHEEGWNKEQTKRNLISDEWENFPVGYDAYRKSNKDLSHRKKRDIIERLSPSQFRVFKPNWRRSKIRAEEARAYWDAVDRQNDITLAYFSTTKRRKSRKDIGKTQDLNTRRVGRTKTNDKIARDHNNESLIASENKTKNGTQNHETLSVSESRNLSKHLIVSKDSVYNSSVYSDSIVSKHIVQDNALSNLDHQLPGSRKSKMVSEEWKRSARSLKFNQEDLAVNDRQLIEKDEEESVMSHSSLADEVSLLRTQLDDFDRNSQTIRQSDDDNNEEEEDEEEENDNDMARQRMSPLYARDTPDSSIENSEEEDEEEEKLPTHDDSSRKPNLSEFSGEKIVIRSPSSGHRSDMVTIAPTDAIEDNALDVPREIESTTEPLQGKILNCDEELFVECCSRLKATSENELRGAKKIKLDHSESYHRQNDQPQGLRVNRDRWRDVESQNSLGSLLESVNQLLGSEEMNSHDRSYRTHGSERSSRSASPDRVSRVDNLCYEDSLDVAFEYNNKLRDKIQQRMRESENLIASTFGQKINDDDQRHLENNKRDGVGNSYSSSNIHEQQLSASIGSNREQKSSLGHKNKTNSTLDGLLDKALSNLLHSNGKNDHNGSAPMKLLAELACARAPTSTPPEDVASSGKNHQSVKTVTTTMTAGVAAAMTTKDITTDSPKRSTKELSETVKNSPTKKTRNPIKELFERKKEINERKEYERSKAAFVNSNAQKQRKPKKSKKQQQQQEFPLIRRNECFGGLMEKKKRRGSFDRKGESEKIKDVYEFDEEESQMAPTLGSVMSYRCQVEKNYESTWKTKNDENFDTSLENDKTNYIVDVNKSNAAIDHKFYEIEKFAPKTKGALKSFQSEEQQQQQTNGSITGPMDEFVERKQQRLKRSTEQNVKQSKLKKRGKSSKKRARNAWYENDSSDEFRTAAKAEDVGVGVGISKSQRTCSKGKQNLFAELSTSESEYERNDYEIASERRSLKSRKSPKKSLDVIDDANRDQHVIKDFDFDNGDQVANDWRNREVREDDMKKDHDVAKSESEMSDHSLVIDERKTIDEVRNSDDDMDNQYERTFELDDLYREDTSDAETDEENEEPMLTTEDPKNNEVEAQVLDENVTLQTETVSETTKDDYSPENELIPLEEALDILDGHDLESKNVHAEVQMDNIINETAERVDETSNDGIINEETENKQLSLPEIQNDKEEPDDDVPTLPEKLSSNEKPQKQSDNLPLHVFLSRKVQESKKRKQQQLDKLREEQERILMDLQPTRRQRKCAIGKQGLLAEISSSDEETYVRDNRKGDHDKSRKKRESKEKRKERYLEKKHEQMIAKEQKAIEEEILREVGKRKEVLAQNTNDSALNNDATETNVVLKLNQEKRHQMKEKQRKSGDENTEEIIGQSLFNSLEEINKSECAFPATERTVENGLSPISEKRRKLSKLPSKPKKVSKSENGKTSASKKSKESAEKSKKTSTGKDLKERKSFSGKRDSDDEELKTTKSWNKVEEGVGVAIGRRKRTAALQLYYWSSSSDEEEAPEPIPAPEEEEDDRQEQHGWIVGDSHKRMITMLAMEKQLKERRRRSEDEFELGKSKSKKHRNSTS